MDTGPKKEGETDGPGELHIVILDNGRSRIYADPVYREALRCIRCGACLNHCPIYTKVGGYPYGWAYSGPMGQVLSPLLLGLSKTRDLYQSCTLCDKCVEVCPAGLDHTRLLNRHRRKNREKDPVFNGAGLTAFQEARYRTFAAAAARPMLWRALIRASRMAVNRRARNGMVSEILGKKEGWLAQRDLPQIGRPTFSEWYRKSRSGK